MLDRPRIVKEGNEGEEEEDQDDDEDEDEELPSYLREQSSDEEHAALYSKNKLNANGMLLTFPYLHSCLPCTLFFSSPLLSFVFLLSLSICCFNLVLRSAFSFPLLLHLVSHTCYFRCLLSYYPV